MATQTMRELELKEKEREEKRQSKKEDREERPRKEAPTGKRWKGKDWFVIFSPRMFGEKAIGETPATNPKTLMGRNIEVGLPELLGQSGGDYYRVNLAIDRIDKNAAYTRFNGYSTLKEHVMRVVRKRTQKIESVMYIKTKDEWRLQISSIAILNRNTETAVKKKVRARLEAFIKDAAAQSSIDSFVKSIFSSNLQRKVKKAGSSIYPIRFVEVSKIEVKGVPSAK